MCSGTCDWTSRLVYSYHHRPPVIIDEVRKPSQPPLARLAKVQGLAPDKGRHIDRPGGRVLRHG
ncbi:MAG: hypothetical protein ACRDRT_13575 [Pseudonocardiaceae bacterium]